MPAAALSPLSKQPPEERSWVYSPLHYATESRTLPTGDEDSNTVSWLSVAELPGLDMWQLRHSFCVSDYFTIPHDWFIGAVLFISVVFNTLLSSAWRGFRSRCLCVCAFCACLYPWILQSYFCPYLYWMCIWSVESTSPYQRTASWCTASHLLTARSHVSSTAVSVTTAEIAQVWCGFQLNSTDQTSYHIFKWLVSSILILSWSETACRLQCVALCWPNTSIILLSSSRQFIH